MSSKFKYIFNAKEEFQYLYFDKLLILSIDKCLKLHKEFKIGVDDNDQTEMIDMRNKYIEACLDKVFAFHKIYDEELSNYNKI